MATNARPYLPEVPAAGHVTGGGHWHPGAADGCVKCAPPASHRVRPGVEFTHPDLSWRPNETAGDTPADASCARCVVTGVHGRSVYFRYVGAPSAHGAFTASLPDVDRWVRAESRGHR